MMRRPTPHRRAARFTSVACAVWLAACGGSTSTAPSDLSVVPTERSNVGSATSETSRGLNAGVETFEVAGVPVLLKPTPSNAVLSIRLYIDGGVRGWDEERLGAEALALGALARGGPRSMTRGSWNATLDRVGASVGAASQEDMSVVHLSVLRPALETVWPAFAEALTAPAFRSTDIELHREQMLAALLSEADDPDSAVRLAARDLFFADHPYAMRPEGSVESLAALTETDLRDAMARLLQRRRMQVVVVGSIDRDALTALLDPLLTSLPEGEAVSRPSPSPIEGRAAAVRFVARPELPTNYVLGYFPAPAPSDADYPAVRLALELLSDRLFEEVRTRRNLSYAVASGLSFRRANFGYLYVTATDLPQTLAVMRATIQNLIDDPIEPEVLRGTLAVWQTGHLMSQALNETQGAQLAAWELIAGDRMGADRLLEQMAAITPEEIARVLDTWVRGVQFAIVGDDSVGEAVFTEGW